MTAKASTELAGVLAAEENKLLACIHCGLCLEACPTYVHTGDENDSPRGRIYLMRAVEETRISASSETFARHINRCLGCRACELACPAGVEYGQLLEAARAEIKTPEAKRKVTSKLLHIVLKHLWLHPSRLRFAFAAARLVRDAGLINLLLKARIARLVSPRMEFALALLESSARASPPERVTDRREALRDKKAVSSREGCEVKSAALLFTGCVTEGLFARINQATKRVLALNNCATQVPREQVCCGALHAHAGDLEGARTLARRNIEAFDVEAKEALPVVTNAGGCGAMLLSYGHLLANDEQYAKRAKAFSERVRDISQQLETTGIKKGGAEMSGNLSVTYDASCHLLYGQRADEAPLEMLRAVSGLRFVPLEASAVCCGGAGVYNLLQPELSARVLHEKLAHIKETGAWILATGNPGCHMQIGAGARLCGMPSLRVCHPVELLDESYERAGFYAEIPDRQ
ncbi:MAG: (Fe-S)-binding protein [Pyrinomonadaceae bacterium]